MVGRVIDSLIVFRILKMLTTDFKKYPAYKFGFIDKDGNRIKFLPDPKNKNQMLPNNPITKDEKNSLTPLHRLVFNLKKLIRMVYLVRLHLHHMPLHLHYSKKNQI